VQSALALTPELAHDVAIGDDGDEREREYRTAYKEQEEASPEPALQRCRS
jgi:hypothetical protein